MRAEHVIKACTHTAAIVMLGVLTFGSGQAFAVDPSTASAEEIFKRAYQFGFPIVDSYRIQYSYFVDEDSPEYKGDWNQVHSVARVYTPEDKAIQTPNSDTPFSFLGADLRAEPLVLTVPEVEEGRYYSIQFIDMYTHNFAYVGSRTTGNDAAHFLLTGPDWKGTVPDSIEGVLRSETEFAFLLYRTQLFGVEDLDNVTTIQSGYKATPLSAFLGEPAPEPLPPVDFFPPLSVEDQKTSVRFFDELNFLLQFCPPHPSEKALRKSFSDVGIVPGEPFSTESRSETLKSAAKAGIQEAWAEFATFKAEELDTGRQSAAEGFGTRELMQGRYLERMASAALGIYGNSKEEALYPAYYTDGEGRPLSGEFKYTLRFEEGELPPADAFWSLTLYQLPESLLYDNEIDRYLINSPMIDELAKADDGSITLYIQHQRPMEVPVSNWLPAPEGPFWLILRLYQPRAQALKGAWKQPPLLREPDQ